MSFKKFSSFPLNEKFSGLNGLCGLVPNYVQHMREYIVKSPKPGRNRFNSIVKTIYISYLPIFYLWRTPMRRFPRRLEMRHYLLHCKTKVWGTNWSQIVLNFSKIIHRILKVNILKHFERISVLILITA